MLWQFYSFDELSRKDLYALLRLRAAVFVVEQDCIYQDLDNKDQNAFHLLGKTVEGTLIAYARIISTPTEEPYAFIGRVVVHPKKRQQNWGFVLMQKAIAFCSDQFPQKTIKISAQKHLQDFYSSLGFEFKGEDYLEDNIPHCAMYYSPG